MSLVADDRKVTLLSLLDMSAVFGCVDHLILIQRLQVAFGIRGTALDWTRLFISGRSQQVVYGDQQSATSTVMFDVPQGTVLGPLLYSFTRLRCSTSSRSMESMFINMPTTCSCIYCIVLYYTFADAPEVSYVK